MSLRLRPWSLRLALPFIKRVHRRLPDLHVAMWAISVRRGADVVGCAVVGSPARAWMEDDAVLCVARVAVIEGHPNACSMLYGACSRAAKAMGAEDLVTYTHADETGISLKAAGWVDAGMTKGGESHRPSRPRGPVVDARPKRRWFAPWGMRARAVGDATLDRDAT